MVGSVCHVKNEVCLLEVFIMKFLTELYMSIYGDQKDDFPIWEVYIKKSRGKIFVVKFSLHKIYGQILSNEN